jgi:branched-chain amino acid transport system substrate-binding protein
MKKILLWLLFVVVLAIILFVNAKRAEDISKGDKPVLKIGVIAPLTGDNAPLGEDMRNGVTLAVEEAQDKIPFVVKPIFEDDQLESRQTNECARRLISLNHVDFLFTLWTPSANLVGRIADEAHVIQFNTSWDAAPTEKYKWTLMHGATYQDYADKVIDIIKKSGAKRVAIASNVELGNNMCIAYAEPILKKAGIDVVFDEKYAPGTYDLRTYFLKLRETKPDFIWHHNNPPGDIIFFRAWAQLGDKLPATGYYDFMRPEYKEFGRWIEGDVFASSLYTTPEFTEKYTRRFKYPPYVRAGHFYDMTRIVIQAADTLYKKLGRMPNREELLTELKRPKELPDLVVGPGRMTTSGWVESHYVLRQIKDGKIIDYAPKKN